MIFIEGEPYYPVDLFDWCKGQAKLENKVVAIYNFDGKMYIRLEGEVK